MKLKKIHSILIVFLLLFVGNYMGFTRTHKLCNNFIKSISATSLIHSDKFVQVDANDFSHDTLFESFSERENTSSSNANANPPVLAVLQNVVYNFGVRVIGYVMPKFYTYKKGPLKISRFRYLYFRNIRI